VTEPEPEPTPASAPAPAPASAPTRRETRLLQLAAVLTLIGLALMVWSILQPTPLPVMLAMSVGQAIGSSAFAIYLFVVIKELRREYRK
jgi:ferric-dicitrate binding protein FerR (iron transport regulator)